MKMKTLEIGPRPLGAPVAAVAEAAAAPEAEVVSALAAACAPSPAGDTTTMARATDLVGTEVDAEDHAVEVEAATAAAEAATEVAVGVLPAGRPPGGPPARTPTASTTIPLLKGPVRSPLNIKDLRAPESRTDTRPLPSLSPISLTRFDEEEQQQSIYLSFLGSPTHTQITLK